MFETDLIADYMITLLKKEFPNRKFRKTNPNLTYIEIKANKESERQYHYMAIAIVYEDRVSIKYNKPNFFKDPDCFQNSILEIKKDIERLQL